MTGVDGPNSGWTTLGGKGAFSGVELLESGSLRGRLRLTRAGESWEITWTASSAWFRWRASRGFRFASISASPYLPFDRCVSGSEYTGPNGPGEEESEPAQIGPRDWTTLPGGHMVYYPVSYTHLRSRLLPDRFDRQADVVGPLVAGVL